MPSSYAFNVMEFDDPPRIGEEVDGSAPQRIANTLREAGLDAPASLYNEALTLARDGHLGHSAARLQMLLCMDPEDADALLLLARVHAAQGRPEEALKRLDASISAGAVAPPGFRDLLESAIQARNNQDEELRNRVAARDQGELRGLRAEAKQLRTETIRLEQDVQEALRRERTWKMATVGVALFATGVVLALMVLPPSTTPEQIAAIQSAGVTAEAGMTAGAGASAGAEGAGAAGAAILSSNPDVPGATAAAPPATAAAPPVTPKATPATPKATPDATPKAATPKATPAATPKATPGGVHVVASGDTLGSIAVRYYGGLSGVKKIQDANQDVLKGGDKLKLGMKLKIP